MATDCSRCIGLCCVALAFERSAYFALTKPAGVRCPYLGDGDRCRIHDERAARGFAGCIRYDCHGAGERLVARIGREKRTTGPELVEAFRIEREIADARLLIETAARLPLGEADEARRADLAAALDVETWPAIGRAIATFLRSLSAAGRDACASAVTRLPPPP